MRHNATDAERRLWSSLRDRRLGGFKFRRQVPIDGFIVDFYCLERKLAVELDGSQHGEEEAIAYDEKRTRILGRRAFRVMRFSNTDVLKDTDIVLREIFGALEQNPHPNPLPEYRERG